MAWGRPPAPLPPLRGPARPVPGEPPGVWREAPAPAAARARPRVRLARSSPRCYAMAELLRAAGAYSERARFSADERPLAMELLRRGVLEPYTHFSRVDGAWVPNSVAAARVADLALQLAELGLLGERRVKSGRRVHRSYWLTDDGRATLADWDDPCADGA